MSKHLTFDERLTIEQQLGLSKSFKAIALLINKDCNTISREIRSHYKIKSSGAYGKVFNNCIHRSTCTVTALCDDCYQSKNRHCKYCIKCSSHCPNYKEELCPRLLKPPYICNGCKDFSHCTLIKHLYDSSFAQSEYLQVLKESRTGVMIDQKEIDHLNQLLLPLIKLQGQSIYQAITNNKDQIMHSDKTIYKLIDLGLLKIRNIDLPRKVRLRQRKKQATSYKVDKHCLQGRTHEEYLEFRTHHLDCPIVQMDSVEGTKGGKVLLTIHFVDTSFMLAFLRDYNDSKSVIDCFKQIFNAIGLDKFKQLFPVILTDNGSEFSNPKAIEYLSDPEEQLTYVFYCHPSSPYEKGACEVNHELLRRIFKKGTSFDELTQDDVNLMMSHINSYKRKKLNNKSPYFVFSSIYGKDTIDRLGIQEIEPNQINLTSSLLKK